MTRIDEALARARENLEALRYFPALMAERAAALAVIEAAKQVETNLLQEPLLHSDQSHRDWLTAEVRKQLAPLWAALNAWADAVLNGAEG